MIFKLLRFIGFFVLARTLESIGYGWNTKEHWIIVVTTLVMCVVCAVEEMV